MGLSDLTRRGVIKAMAECDQLGRMRFLHLHGFGPSRDYVLEYAGRWYDSKAVCGVAHLYDHPSGEVLSADRFSGGLKGAVGRLEDLGFTVLHDPVRAEILDPDGKPVKSTCEVWPDGDTWALTVHSRGGAQGSPAERNPGYRTGLELLLARLGAAKATVTDVLLDSQPAHQVPVDDRRLLEPAPWRLGPDIDQQSMANDLMAAGAKSNRQAKTSSAGNRTKQLRIEFTVPGDPTRDALQAQLTGGRSAVRTFILTWNPKRWDIPEDELEWSVKETQLGRRLPGRWSTGNRTSGIEPGDQVFLFRQESDRGIQASGVATSEVYQDEHFEAPGKEANYIDVSWHAWVLVEDRLPVDTLHNISETMNWNALLGSGVQLDPTDAERVQSAWFRQVGVAYPASPGDESVGGLAEGARKRVEVNRYERNPEARRVCLDHHGTSCAVCGFDFWEAYGDIGEGFIHVHHLVPMASREGAYDLDPIKDLVPVCPNCHAMLHRGVKLPRTIEELRQYRSETS